MEKAIGRGLAEKTLGSQSKGGGIGGGGGGGSSSSSSATTKDHRLYFRKIETEPLAAASIGQVTVDVVVDSDDEGDDEDDDDGDNNDDDDEGECSSSASSSLSCMILSCFLFMLLSTLFPFLCLHVSGALRHHPRRI